MSVAGVIGGRGEPMADVGPFELRPAKAGEVAAKVGDGRKLLWVPVESVAFLAAAGVLVQRADGGVGGNLADGVVRPATAGVRVDLAVKLHHTVGVGHRDGPVKYPVGIIGSGGGSVSGPVWCGELNDVATSVVLVAQLRAKPRGIGDVGGDSAKPAGI